MGHVTVSRNGELGQVTLDRAPVNAINAATIGDIRRAFHELELDDSVRGVVITGAGRFFSFGFDVPELYPLAPEEFT